MKRAISLAPVSILATNAADAIALNAFASGKTGDGKGSAAAPAAPAPGAVPPPPPDPTANAGAAGAATTETKEKPVVKIGEISNDVGIPTNAKRSNRSKYPFDKLPAPVEGQNPPSFPIFGMSAKNLTSVIFGANKKGKEAVKDANGQPVYEMTDIKDAAGNVTGQTAKRDDKGQPIPKMRIVKEFKAYDVDPKTDPQGANVRVFRIK